jgi:carboxypeptidase Taq
MRRQRDHAIATPASLISRLAKATSRAESHWLEARRENDYSRFAPHLEEVLHLVRDKSALLGQALNLAPYDSLLDEFSPGLTTPDIDSIFKALSRRLPGMIRDALAGQEARAVLPITGRFTSAKQRALVVEVMKAVGFPFDRGRLDESEHPFTEGVPGDIRLTTRFDVAEPFTGLLGALRDRPPMYDLGMPAAGATSRWAMTRQGAGREPVAAAGDGRRRSMAFTRYLQPLLVRHFQASGPVEVEISPAADARAPRLSRVDADG